MSLFTFPTVYEEEPFTRDPGKSWEMTFLIPISGKWNFSGNGKPTPTTTPNPSIISPSISSSSLQV
jgi:hypothetical protein